MECTRTLDHRDLVAGEAVGLHEVTDLRDRRSVIERWGMQRLAIEGTKYARSIRHEKVWRLCREGSYLHFHHLHEVGVGSNIHLVEEDDERRNADLAGENKMLTSLQVGKQVSEQTYREGRVKSLTCS